MKSIQTVHSISVPAEIKNVTINSRVVTVIGKHGKLERSFKHLPVDMRYDSDSRTIVITMWLATQKQQACIRTLASHIKNMFTGVTKKYQYKMRLVYAHFPINTNIKESEPQQFEIRNFVGEKRARIVTMMPGVKVERSTTTKDEIILSGMSIEDVSRSAALIHQSTLVKRKDIRKFLDGIYVSEKGTVDE